MAKGLLVYPILRCIFEWFPHIVTARPVCLSQSCGDSYPQRHQGKLADQTSHERVTQAIQERHILQAPAILSHVAGFNISRNWQSSANASLHFYDSSIYVLKIDLLTIAKPLVRLPSLGISGYKAGLPCEYARLTIFGMRAQWQLQISPDAELKLAHLGRDFSSLSTA